MTRKKRGVNATVKEDISFNAAMTQRKYDTLKEDYELLRQVTANLLGCAPMLSDELRRKIYELIKEKA